MIHMIIVPSNRTLLGMGYWTELFNNPIQDTKKSSHRSTLPLIRLLVFFLVFFPSIFSSSKRRPLVAPVDAPAISRQVFHRFITQVPEQHTRCTQPHLGRLGRPTVKRPKIWRYHLWMDSLDRCDSKENRKPTLLYVLLFLRFT